MKIEITRLEDPFPVGDSVHKGNAILSAGNDLEVLSQKFSIVAKWQTYLDGKPDMEKVAVLGEDSSVGQDYSLMGYQYPINMKKGDEQRISFLISNIDIPAQLDKWGLKNKWEDLQANGDLKFMIVANADAKGTPFDPTNNRIFKVVPE